MRNMIRGLVIGWLLVGVAGTSQAGGWALVTFTPAPKVIFAGEETRIEFEVAWHGVHPFDADPRLMAVSPSGVPVPIDSEWLAPGKFATTVRFDEIGRWTWSTEKGSVASVYGTFGVMERQDEGRDAADVLRFGGTMTGVAFVFQAVMAIRRSWFHAA